MPQPQVRRENGGERELGGSDAEMLLRRIAEGYRSARERIFEQYRPRLWRIVRSLLGKRNRRALADASDIGQKAMAVAAKRLDDYLARRPLPLFPWLCVLTRDQICKARKERKHPGADMGQIPVPAALADESSRRVTDILIDTGTTPSHAAMRNELRRKVRDATTQSKPEHREVLVMCYGDGLKLTEIAAILGIGESAARMRHLRAIEEMNSLLGDWDGEATG
jgi:RNA polymerase sigma-70 factor (ECF subfamily)